MSSTYAVCEKCNRVNRVQLDSGRSPICGACKIPLPIQSAMVEVSDKSVFSLIKSSPLPIVLDVWAPWCGPCRAFAPTFAELSQNFAGKIVFAKLNSEVNPSSSQRLEIRSIPTLILFKNGKELTRISGALSREQLASWLEQAF